jgi:hypothetical protein
MTLGDHATPLRGAGVACCCREVDVAHAASVTVFRLHKPRKGESRVAFGEFGSGRTGYGQLARHRHHRQ